jgi:hypothetical protein
VKIADEIANKIINPEKSREIAKKINSRPGECFYNASTGSNSVDNGQYVIGYVWGQHKKYAIEHGWIESDGEIIDPTLILLDNNIKLSRYFPVLQFNHEEMIQELLENNSNPGFHLMAKHANKMTGAQGLIKENIGISIDFIGKK